MKEFLAVLATGLFLLYLLAAPWVFGVLTWISVATRPMPGWQAVLFSILGFLLIVAGLLETLALGFLFREMDVEATR